MLIVVVSLFVLVYGSYLAAQMSIDVFPDLDRPRVVIITEAPGLATEEVETLVTQPIEIALMGANGVQAVRSQSTAGLNVIYIEFDWSTEIRAARQTVQERLSTLEGILPDGIRPQMTPPSSIMGQIIVAGIYRQNGPNGGRLTQVGTTEMMAEMVVGQNGKFQIGVWMPGDRHDFSTWKKLIRKTFNGRIPQISTRKQRAFLLALPLFRLTVNLTTQTSSRSRNSSSNFAPLPTGSFDHDC